ncbi:MAG: cytochrome c biogenesis protein CcsA [Deltaproteobacteria bacterium]|nr:cytochrome c biogenesis protein CcsA [Deltaproteobacteria bacterium]
MSNLSQFIAKYVVGDFPSFGLLLLLAVMVSASYTFAVALSAGSSGRIKTLMAARLGAYGTVALIGVAVLCLAYAFVSHDFRLRYVAHYSDRGMPLIFLLTALWGGQDGSLLWWLFLLSLYIGVCVWQLGKKYLELQPYILATLMGIVIFFCVLMAFAANPFATGVSGARPDGEGLNPLLQNFYMIIHPPSLYVGFVGCSIPFAFCVAALVTGRLDAEWIQASRKFSLFALMFLAIGNTLGMLWAYEELGWGGYWAWDPVENAAFMPLLSLAAFVHSVMIQERRGMLKVWNVFLMCLTFFMTIFGTFLTRSGVIASVHSFAQSSIGDYFLVFLAIVAAFCFTLVLYRWPELRDLTPTPELRRAAITTGWITLISLCAAWLAASRIAPAGGDMDANGKRTLIQVGAFSVLAGAAVYASIELVFRRMTTGLKLKSKRPKFESVLSREFTFLLNNYGLLAVMFFVLVGTTFPMVSEALWKEKVTVGPPHFNAWLQPLGLGVFFLMGVGTLFGWKKSSEEQLKKNFSIPVGLFFVTVAAHFALGKTLGHPAVVWSPPVYAGPMGTALQAFNAYTPVLGISLSVFNIAVIVQEFVLLYKSRLKTGAEKTPKVLWMAGLLPGFVYSLASLPPVGRRRYGGYIVHLGIVLMFLGWTGKSWNNDVETTIKQGDSYTIERLTLTYAGPRMEVDNNKRMIFADIRVSEGGKEIGKLSPAKFIYKKMPDSPTTEVAMLHSIRDDLYVVVGSINPESKVASLQIHLNPLVGWIWLGGIIIIFGSILCMWPELEPEESRVWQVARGAGAIATSITLGVVIALLPVPAFAQSTASQHSGSVHIDDMKEKHLFSQLRCMCGTCARELLSSCACSTADATRDRMRTRLSKGESVEQIIDEYVKEYGTASLAIPPNQGAMRLIYVAPVVALVGGGIGLAVVLRRWRANATGGKDAGEGASEVADASSTKKKKGAKNDADADEKKASRPDDYDARIDAELRDLDG